MYSNKKIRLDISDDSSSSGQAFLYVSFYLVLLAFFILLNSIASIEEKRQKASVGSVQSAFSGGSIASSMYNTSSRLTFKVDSGTGVGSQLVLENYASKIKKIAKESVALIDAKMVEYGNNLRIEMPLKSFFAENSTDVNEYKYAFLDKIFKEIKTKPNLSLEIVLPDQVTNSYPDVHNNIFLKRSSSIIQKIIENRVDLNRVHVGISTIQPADKIVLWFLDKREEKEKEKNDEINNIVNGISDEQ